MQQDELEYAGFWIRVWATVIDCVLILALTAPLLVMIYGWGYFTEPADKLVRGPAEFLINYVLPGIAVIVFWVSRQATPGKMAISARIVDARTGEPPSTAQCIGRYFAYIVSMLPLGAGLVWVAFDRRKQAWHDKLAGTVVVRPRKRGPEPVRFGGAGTSSASSGYPPSIVARQIAETAVRVSANSPSGTRLLAASSDRWCMRCR